MQITKYMKMAEVIHLNYLLLPVINRFGIELGFGESNVEDVCVKNNINIDFFLEIVNAFHDKDYFPAAHLQSFSVQEIIRYLKRSHHYFMGVKIPEIEKYISELFHTSDALVKKKAMALIQFFDQYKSELTLHIKREEEIVYPYVVDLSICYENNKITEIILDKIKAYPISAYEAEHDNIEEKLFDLKNILIKYFPNSNNTLSTKILIELFRLEKDLKDHQLIEDKVLIPKVVELEYQFLQKKNEK